MHANSNQDSRVPGTPASALTSLPLFDDMIRSFFGGVSTKRLVESINENLKNLEQVKAEKNQEKSKGDEDFDEGKYEKKFKEVRLSP